MQSSLSSLLSQALVAFTIEADNEFELRMPHRTSDFGAGAAGSGPWLTSLAMYLNCMRYVDQAGITVAELAGLARTPANLAGMLRWGYVTIDGAGRGSGAKPAPGSVIRATARGARAREAWRPLPELIEQRWRQRFGEPALDDLTASLGAIAGQLSSGLPDCMPILGYGLWTKGRITVPLATLPGGDDAAELPLCALLARVLVAFTLDFEEAAAVSLAITANILRVLGEAAGSCAIRDLPARSGVSKEAIAMALGVLDKQDLAVAGPDPAGGRGKLAVLTPKGRSVTASGQQLIAAVDASWQSRFGQDLVKLREVLEPLAGQAGQPSPLLAAIPPYPDGWRARVRQPELLPRFPMVLHRGGYPDGS